jgi:hypothetical protein
LMVLLQQSVDRRLMMTHWNNCSNCSVWYDITLFRNSDGLTV